GIDEEQVFQHMSLFLAAITRLLFSRVCGARNGSLGAVMTKRGAAVGVAHGRLRPRRPPRAAALPPLQDGGVRMRHCDTGHPLRSARRSAPPGARRESIGSLWTGACRTSVHGADEWDAA